MTEDMPKTPEQQTKNAAMQASFGFTLSLLKELKSIN